MWNRMAKGAVLLGTVILLCAPPAPAQKEGAAEPDGGAAVKELFAAMGSDKQFDVVINTMMRGMGDMLKQQHPAHSAVIDEVFALLAAKFLARKNELIDMVAPLYSEKFTVDDMKQLTAFFTSPLGRRFIVEQPGIIEKSMIVGMAWGEQIGREVEREAVQELRKRGLPI